MMRVHGRRWSTKEIADYLSYSEKYARDVVVHHPDFPKPIINTSKKKRMWLSDSVIDFGKKRRDFTKNNDAELTT